MTIPILKGVGWRMMTGAESRAEARGLWIKKRSGLQRKNNRVHALCAVAGRIQDAQNERQNQVSHYPVIASPDLSGRGDPSLWVTVFKVRVRYQNGYGRLAMTAGKCVPCQRSLFCRCHGKSRPVGTYSSLEKEFVFARYDRLPQQVSYSVQYLHDHSHEVVNGEWFSDKIY